MSQLFHIKSNHRLGVLVFLGFLASIGIGTLQSTPTHATCSDDLTPCVEVSFGTPQGGNLSVRPGLAYYDSTQFYLPVGIGLKSTSVYTVKVYGSGSNLVSGSDSIPTISTDTAYADLGKNGSEWGIRWNFGDTVEDKDTNYHKVPSSSSDDSSIVVENQSLPKSTTMIKKQLTLGFAVAVDGNQPSGSYTNTITVAVVASPRDARSFFDISTMQEMTAEICANTTTPAKTATTQFDTEGIHPDDPNYVPETTLTDTRDGKTYLVRKLADGNCWMSQNLSLMLDKNTTLTYDDTDLTSKGSWTPTHTTQTSAGTAWGQNDNKDHSCSYGWSGYWAGNSTFNATGQPGKGGTAGYAQRGVYYNWFAATAGSGKSTDTYNTIDVSPMGSYIINGTVQDSICPKGWTLPVGGVTAVNATDGSVKSFYNLVQLYTGKTGNFSTDTTLTLYASPMNFVPSGGYGYVEGVISNAGERQLYLTATANTTANSSFYLDFSAASGSSSTVYPGTGTNYKGGGRPMRCVAR